MIRLVVTDIDDTLVCRERRVITKRGQAAMHALMDAGIVVGPATGRDVYRVGYSFRFDHALYLDEKLDLDAILSQYDRNY